MFTSIISLCCAVWRVRRWRLHRRGVLEALRGVRIHWPVVSSVPFLAHRTHPQQHCTHGSSCNRVEESKWFSRYNITTQVADCHKKACVSSCAPGVVVEFCSSGYNLHELALAFFRRLLQKEKKKSFLRAASGHTWTSPARLCTPSSAGAHLIIIPGAI